MKKWFALLVVILFATSCAITGKTVYEEDGFIETFFCPEDGCLEKILELINTSQEIKCAFYDLDIPILIKVLNEKEADIILEDSNALDEFSTGYSAALMHNKFCIFDKKVVVTGSMNPTERGNYYNNNNIIIVQSKQISKNYLDEFEELKLGMYGGGKKTEITKTKVGNILVENYFCPEDNCKLHVINTLKEANSSIYFMTYSFTDVDIGNLLWNKEYLGLDVKGIFEEKQISEYSRYRDLKEFSVLDNNKYTMHHKVFIIDNKTVITGSFNPTKNANERNDENILIIHNLDIAKEFIEEFIKVYNEKQTYPKITSGVFFKEIVYDAVGSDLDKEYIIIKNTGNLPENLEYYFISDEKNTKRLNGVVEKNSEVKIISPLSLKNKNGTLILKKTQEIIDYVFWEGKWNIVAKEGQKLIRINDESISENSWTVAQIK